jgi:hypothetical protein
MPLLKTSTIKASVPFLEILQRSCQFGQKGRSDNSEKLLPKSHVAMCEAHKFALAQARPHQHQGILYFAQIWSLDYRDLQSSFQFPFNKVQFRLMTEYNK